MKPVARYLSFTGNTGSYGELPLGVLAGATTYTIEVKFSTTSTKSAGEAWNWGHIFGRTGRGYGYDYIGLCVNGGKLCFWASPASKGSSNSNIQSVTSNATVSDGKIHKAAVVSNADGSIDLYCDGELVAHTDNVNAKITDAQTILIAYNSDSDSLLQMDFYEARFWSIARTQEQIFADIQGDEAGLEAWYIPNGSATLVDGSINGRDATLYGSPAYTYVDIMPIDISFDVERVVQNDAYIKQIAQSLKVWLPFDTSTTADKCGNSWTAYGTPAIENGKLVLNGSSYLINSQIAADIDDDIWTIHWRATAAASGERFFFGTFNANYGTSGTGSNKWVSVLWYSGNVSISLYGNDTRAGVSLSQNQEYHYALSYDGTNLRLFIDGALKITKSANIKLGGNFRIGIDPSRNTSEAYFKGSIDEFIILKGVAWTANFTPPTADDYIQLAIDFDGRAPIDLSFDVARKIKNADKTWRYVNAGTADTLTISGTTLTDLPESKSITGTAFYQTERVKCFDIPATDEIWIKFDVYFDGSNRWRAYNGGNNGTTGITAQTDGRLGFFSNDTDKGHFNDVCKKNQLQTVLLHMVSGSSAGVVEAWVDGSLIYTYTGDVNHGEDFADIYLQSDGAGTFFSNVIISNAEIELGEGWQIFTFDVERQVTRTVDIDFDVERQVQNIVPFQLGFDVELKELLPVTISADTERKVIVPVDFSADVELLSIVLVDFTADLARNIKANINLYKTDNSQYFSGGSSVPIVIPTQEVVPPATDSEAVTQSIEITIAEQQLTDQVKVVTAIPLDIMYPVQGQYLDYCCDMRVERVSKQGVLYTADCCTDLDELLYTPLNYDLPNILRVKIEQSDSGDQSQSKPKSLIITMPCEASKHVAKFADALGLTPVMQFEDFYTSVDVKDQKESGSTYADLIRDIFGWSARVLTQVINCYIRNGKLFVIQRGHESNVIDISNADMTTPVYTHELIRLYYQRNKYTDTTTQTKNYNKRIPVAKSSEVSSGDTETTYKYDDDDLLEESRTVTYDKDHNRIETITNYDYTELKNGRKVLTEEHTVKYVNSSKEEETTTYHTPLNQGLAHSVRVDEDGDIIGEGVGQNSNDDRVTPYSQYEDDYKTENETKTTTTTVEGLSLIDTSFPIQIDIDIDDSDWEGELPYSVVAARNAIDKSKGVGRLQQITDDIKFLNRKTLETVTLSIYNYPHVIDFNDRVVLFGHEYYLVSNRAQTTPRIYDEQALTLVRWF